MARNIKFTLAIAVTCWAMWAMSEAYRAHAHSWYPPACCAGNDCAPVIKMGRTKDGKYLVKTKHGTMLFPADQKILPSKDGRWHGCAFMKQIVSPGILKGRCLLGGGWV